jgi:altronate hydrolase
MDILFLDPKDNVAVALRDLEINERISWDADSLQVRSFIPQGHKIALQHISTGEAIIKYGMPIGLAKVPIEAGEHVHIHNVTSAYCNNEQDHYE